MLEGVHANDIVECGVGKRQLQHRPTDGREIGIGCAPENPIQSDDGALQGAGDPFASTADFEHAPLAVEQFGVARQERRVTNDPVDHGVETGS